MSRWATGIAILLRAAADLAAQSADSCRSRYLLPAIEIVASTGLGYWRSAGVDQDESRLLSAGAVPRHDRPLVAFR